MKFEVKSFGYLHLEHPPKANLVFDVQDLAYDPNLNPDMRELSGSTVEIRQFCFRQSRCCSDDRIIDIDHDQDVSDVCTSRSRCAIIGCRMPWRQAPIQSYCR